MQDKLHKTHNWISKITWNITFFNDLLEKWKSALDKEENICVIFMDLSKAFDTINHDLLLAKLKTYRFSINPLDLMCSYLKNRRQSVQINNNFRSAKKKYMWAFPRVPLIDLFYLIYL